MYWSKADQTAQTEPALQVVRVETSAVIHLSAWKVVRVGLAALYPLHLDLLVAN